MRITRKMISLKHRYLKMSNTRLFRIAKKGNKQQKYVAKTVLSWDPKGKKYLAKLRR